MQLSVWLIGEFGEMLVNGTCKNADGSQMIIPAEDVLAMYERILGDYNSPKVERGEIIVMWSLTALSKLSIRLQNDMLRPRIIDNLKKFAGSANCEIQQRALEFSKLLGDEWGAERPGIFEPMPFKGDENMLVADAANRAAMGDDDEGESPLGVGENAGGDDLLMALGGDSKAAQDVGGLLDLGDLMGGGGAQPV